MKQRLFIVSNRLPLTVVADADGYSCRPSSGGLVSSISAWLDSGGKDGFSELHWAGVTGCEPDIWEAASGRIDSGYQYLPVFMDELQYERYYNGFSNSLVWPLFHYFPSFADYDPNTFDAYIAANRVFADRLTEILEPGDVVWIHDYHLMPLAGMLRAARPEITIGFFLHIPFPSYEMFRVIPKRWQRALLEGMLGADLVGFHTIEYTRHFEHCLDLVLHAKSWDHHLSWQGRIIGTGAFPISIDFNKFHDASAQEGVQESIRQYLGIKGDRKLIFSVDRLDYTKGISNRLRGYEQFLTDHPEYMGNVIFALNIIPSRDSIVTYAERKKMIDEYIGSFNARLGNIGWQPVLYQYSHMSFEELCGLYCACDLALITPLRDGMNLVAKEFVASRTGADGVLVLSEMAGAANELKGALLINPNDVYEVAEMIRAGLEMPEEEQRQRMHAMQERIRSFDVVAWSASFFNALRKVRNMDQPEARRQFNREDFGSLEQAYQAAKRRLILLDYDGTLAAFADHPDNAVPSDECLQTLSALADDPANTVFVISGRDSGVLEPWLGHLPLGLVASHGARIRRPRSEWHLRIPETPRTWMAEVSRTMQESCLKMPRSFVEEKEFSIAWHYRNVAPELQAGHPKGLQARLKRQVRDMGLELLLGDNVFEVRSPGMNKGAAVLNLLEDSPYDFVLAVGDDRTDEDMFSVLQSLPAAHTVKVGPGDSLAEFRLDRQDEVLPLLHALINNAG
jgi:trehalose 6-phosphate synthase/phosphatase